MMDFGGEDQASGRKIKILEWLVQQHAKRVAGAWVRTKVVLSIGKKNLLLKVREKIKGGTEDHLTGSSNEGEKTEPNRPLGMGD